MNPYDNAVIKVKKFQGKGDRIYADLVSAGGELLISATLKYIVLVLECHMTKVKEI